MALLQDGTRIYGTANVDTQLNVNTTFVANTTGAYHTGTMNAVSHTIGTNLIANTLGVYHTGTVNAASHTVGTGVVANSSGIYSNAGFNSTVNNQRLTFTPIAGGANVFFNQQGDDNFVFYSTNTTNGSRAIWSVFGNNNTSNLSISVPLAATSNLIASTNTFTLGTSSIAANGYTRLPNGLLMQWGTQTASVNATTTATGAFSTAFTTVYSFQLTAKGAVNGVPAALSSSNNTNFVWYTTYGAAAASTVVYYLVIGI